jgi:hypothetical protein
VCSSRGGLVFSAHGGQRPKSMTRGPGPPCQRLGHLGACRARSSAALRGVNGGILLLKRDSPKRDRHSHHRPFALEFSTLLCRRSRHVLARPSRAPPARGSTQLGAEPARMGCAGVCRKNPCRCLSLQRPCCWRVCVQTPQRVGATEPGFLRAAVGGAWPSASTRNAVLHPSGGHHRLPPWDVRGGDAPSRFFLQHPGGRMITSLVKVDSGLSHGSIPRAPNSLGVGSEPCCGSDSLASMASVPLPTPPSGRWLPVHRTGDGRAVHRSAVPIAELRRRLP